MAWVAWEGVGIFKQKRTPVGAESRRAYIQLHSGVCFEDLPSSMGSGLIVLNVWGGMGESSVGCVYVWPPWQPCSCKPWLGISEPLLSSLSCFSIPSPLCPQPSGVPKGQCLESLRGEGSRAVPWGPGRPTAPTAPCYCLPCLALLASASPQPPRLSAPLLSQSQFPGIITFSGWLPPPCQTWCWEIPISQASRGFSREAGDWWGGPSTLSFRGSKQHCSWMGQRSWGRAKIGRHQHL